MPVSHPQKELFIQSTSLVNPCTITTERFGSLAASRSLLIQVEYSCSVHRLFGCIRSCCSRFHRSDRPRFSSSGISCCGSFSSSSIRPVPSRYSLSAALLPVQIRLHLCKYKSRNHTEQHSTYCHSRHTYRDFRLSRGFFSSLPSKNRTRPACDLSFYPYA